MHATAWMNLRKHYAKWRKAETKGHIVFDSFDMIYPK